MASGSILVVDEPREAVAVKSIFAATSYRILTASRGVQALDILEADRRVEVVLSEVLLPDATDGAFLAKVRLSYPHLAVMFMTRDPGPVVDPAIPVVIKPASSSLVQKVEDLLVENRAAARSLRAGVAEARQLLQENVRRSRQERCDRFCAGLRIPGARIRTILLAEDNSALRYSVSRYLVRCGFHVLDAPDGVRALELSRQHRGAIDMLLTDFEMPGLDGLSLAPAIEAERPGVRTLLMTGADTPLSRPTIRKPFELEDLLAEIVGLLVRS